ncbi:MAG: peptidoglycan DD-metalloendopeptidase family protein [Acidobacteriota bacterium]
MSKEPPAFLRRYRRTVMVLALLATVGLLTFVAQDALEPEAPILTVSRTAPYPANVVPASMDLALGAQVPEAFTLRRGQTIGGLFADLGFEAQEAYAASSALGEVIDLRKVRSGEVGLVYRDPLAGGIDRLRLRLDRRGWVTLERAADDWRAELHEFTRRTERRQLSGRLESFLIADIERAGGPQQLALAMSQVLQWDLDFNRDLRQGDFFAAVFDEVSIDGHVSEVGAVQALVYENRGVRYEAYLFELDGVLGYYDAEGRPLQKQFLRSPLPFMRVTSRFSHSRFHPVLKKYRPHYGVDFGAPRGTPIRATASGTVTFAGRSGGAGKMVKLRHANGYETLYLHLSKYGQGVRSGTRVTQGQVIGYVGSTGLSTGPHLDYRVKRNGRYLDPMRLENKPAPPIPSSKRLLFEQRRDELRGQLGPLGVPDVQLASAEDVKPEIGP